MGKRGHWTVDELARAAGCSARNVRAMQSAGLLAPPELHGRTGYYGEEHLRRLDAVLRLQGEGFSLASLRALFAAYDEGARLEDVLGLPARGARRPSSEAAHDPFEGFARRPRTGRVLAVVPSPVLGMLPGEAAS